MYLSVVSNIKLPPLMLWWWLWLLTFKGGKEWNKGVCVCVYVCVCVCDIFQSFITVIHRLSSFFFFLFLIFSSFLSFLFFCIFYIISSLSFFSSHLPNFSSRLCSMAIDSPKPLQYCNDSKHYTYHFYSVYNCPLLRHYKKQRCWLINVNYFYISVVIHLFITW